MWVIKIFFNKKFPTDRKIFHIFDQYLFLYVKYHCDITKSTRRHLKFSSYLQPQPSCSLSLTKNAKKTYNKGCIDIDNNPNFRNYANINKLFVLKFLCVISAWGLFHCHNFIKWYIMKSEEWIIETPWAKYSARKIR